MRASDLMRPFPTVTVDTPAIEAARLMGTHNLPGLVVLDDDGAPVAVLPGTQVLRMAIPTYCVDDPALARVVDEAAADVFLRGLGDKTVAEVLRQRQTELPVVDLDATALELAALMARVRSPLVAVVHDGQLRGVVTLDNLIDQALVA